MSPSVDPIVLLLAPVLLAAVVGLLGLVGCDLVFQAAPEDDPRPIAFLQVLVNLTETAIVESVTAPFASPVAPVTPGSLIVVWIWFHSAAGQTITGITDTTGNTYVPADDLVAGPGAIATTRQQVWYAKNGVGGAGTLTVTFSGPVDASLGVSAFEYANADLTEPLRRASHGTGTSAQAQSPTTQTSDARMLFGAFQFAAVGTNDPDANLRLNQQGNVAEDYLADTLPQQSLASTVPAGDVREWIAQLVAFK